MKPQENVIEITGNELYFAKVKPNAIIPTKEEENGWYDVYACIDEDMLFMPNELKLVPTGLAAACSPKYRMSLGERGSNTKNELSIRAGKIDSGFRGEWFVALRNENDMPVCLTNSVKAIVVVKEKDSDTPIKLIPTSKAIAQFCVEVVPGMVEKEISYEELKLIPSKRGTGMLGSSGK